MAQSKAEGKSRRRRQKKKRRELIDRRLVKAIAHPLRVEILVEMAKAPMSPVEFSRQFEISLSDASYHFRSLHKNDCIEIVEERPKRGALEHIYRVTKRALLSDEDFAELPRILCNGFDASILTTFMQQGQQALEADTMERQSNKHLTWQTLKLDKETFDELVDRLMDLYEAAGALTLAAEARLAESGEDPVYTTLGLFGFESPAPDRQHELENNVLVGKGE